MEGRLGAAPEHDLHFVEQSARGQANRKGLKVEIERAAGVEDARRGRAAGDKADLPMRDVDETMGGSVEHQLQHAADIAASAPSAIKSHSSGPSHKAARLCALARWPSCEGNSAPNAMPQETRTASLPRKMKRAAGAASDNVNRGPAGKAKPSSGERT